MISLSIYMLSKTPSVLPYNPKNLRGIYLQKTLSIFYSSNRIAPSAITRRVLVAPQPRVPLLIVDPVVFHN